MTIPCKSPAALQQSAIINRKFPKSLPTASAVAVNRRAAPRRNSSSGNSPATVAYTASIPTLRTASIPLPIDPQIAITGSPNFYGGTFLTLCGLTQHAGLAENEKDHRLSTRTVILNPVLSFLYCRMEYHIEHHIFPLVPCHNLKQLHEVVKDQMPAPRLGLISAYREIVPAVIKQGSDAAYCIQVQVPA